VLGIGVSPLTFLKIIPPEGVGFYDWEVLTGNDKPKNYIGKDPFHFRQTAKRASMVLTAAHQKGLNLYLKTKYPQVQQHPVKVTILGDLGIIKKETISDHYWDKLSLEPAQIQNTKMLTIEVEKTWNPKLLGIADDDRDLGLAVAFYEKEK
jgi:hypothetical protein